MGDSEISGIEIEGNIALNDYWTLSGTLGMSDSEFKDYQYNFVTAFAKYSQMAGNTMPRYPEDMGSLSASYKNTMNNGWDMFFRADLNYFGETYADESNLATCDSYTLMNARGGVEKDNVRMELYVNNLGDEEAWTACTRWSDFASPSAFAVFTAFQGISVSPMRPRNIGLRISYDF
jgi:outer membrane receptor protein involved in Fe transport